MLLRTHAVVAIFLYLLCFSFLSEKIIFLIFLLIATCFVDIDTKKSKLGKRWYLRPVQWVVSHRGVFHTLVSAILLSGLIYLVNQTAGVAFFAGYVIHLGLDSFTRSGPKLLWPASDFRISLGLKTGGLIEEIIFVLVLLTLVFYSARIFF
jgi:membrane-bound metal-dependent hydrolase YbcI (DUF457 family)